MHGSTRKEKALAGVSMMWRKYFIVAITTLLPNADQQMQGNIAYFAFRMLCQGIYGSLAWAN